MSDTIVTQRGQTLDLRFTWYQGAPDSAPLDLSGAVVTVREASKIVLKEATIELTDAAAGQCRLTTTENQSQVGLSLGTNNWFRLEAQWPDGSNRVTPKINIEVR